LIMLTKRPRETQMPDNSDGWRFDRGLDDDFMEKLEVMAKQPGWFADVLADPDLILGIRNNYVNVYRLGQSLFKIERKGKSGALKISTHPKYLVDPNLSKPVQFDGSKFAVGTVKPLLEEYKGVEALKRMKRAAEPYGGGEKKGLHSIIRGTTRMSSTRKSRSAAMRRTTMRGATCHALTSRALRK
jgi:hypothetical protein